MARGWSGVKGEGQKTPPAWASVGARERGGGVAQRIPRQQSPVPPAAPPPARRLRRSGGEPGSGAVRPAVLPAPVPLQHLADQEKRCYGPAGFGFDCNRAEEYEEKVESRKRRGRYSMREEQVIRVEIFSIHSHFEDFRTVTVITNNHGSRNGAILGMAQ